MARQNYSCFTEQKKKKKGEFKEARWLGLGHGTGDSNARILSPDPSCSILFGCLCFWYSYLPQISLSDIYQYLGIWCQYFGKLMYWREMGGCQNLQKSHQGKDVSVKEELPFWVVFPFHKHVKGQCRVSSLAKYFICWHAVDFTCCIISQAFACPPDYLTMTRPLTFFTLDPSTGSKDL